MDDIENTSPDSPEEKPAEETAPRLGAGQRVRAAREALGIPVSKLCADLRISPATLEALEAGDYSKLAGAPYVRAMLVSLSRPLRLDSRELLQAYADETGSRQATTAPVSPYKDDSGTHAKAHKQIFILLLAVLLFVLLLIMGKVNTSAPAPVPAPPPATGSDTLLKIDPLPEIDSLPADTTRGGILDTARADSARKPAAKAAAPTPQPAAAETTDPEVAQETRVRVLALGDSVWLRVLPAGDRELSFYLRRNKPREFRHRDALTFITRQAGAVRVFLGDSSVVPDKRRFKIDGDQISY
ncbi:MAG TPA: helix-turn-helix domain-containing protein [Fibrobacteria bacterium]|jgi:cytoskeletal protein RodZ|nr:helix-turn-helix domain-containing protein [Fibrobacteria bacterium]